MKVVTKAQALSVLLDSLFRPGRTLVQERFGGGKCRVDQSYIGRDLKDLPGVHAVYTERQRDSDGPYVQLMCIAEPPSSLLAAVIDPDLIPFGQRFLKT